MKLWNKSNNLLIFISLLIATEAFLFFSGNYELNKTQKLNQENLIEIQKKFETAPVLAKSFSIYDATLKEEIYSKNGNDILPLASLSKMMTVIIALEKYKLSDVITVSFDSNTKDQNYALFQGEKWFVSDLAKFTLVSSSNDGALTLSQNDDNFLSSMNKKTGIIGMKSSTFFNFTGLDVDTEKAGSYGTSNDMNIMALYAINKFPGIFSATVLPEITLESKSGYVHDIKNTNIIINKIPNLLFSKTGFTNLAGGNLTVIFKAKDGHIIAITLLGSTEAGRFSDMEKLVEIAYTR